MPTGASLVVAAPTWKRILSPVLDFLTVFVAGGYAIGKYTNQIADGGFNLEGWPALVLFAIIIAYFLVGRRVVGGTIWDRILRIARPQPR